MNTVPSFLDVLRDFKTDPFALPIGWVNAFVQTCWYYTRIRRFYMLEESARKQ